MTQKIIGVMTLFSLTLLTGCGSIIGPTAAEETLQAQNYTLSTQITDLRATATVETDRMMITVEHAATEVRAVSLQRDALRATMIARGTDPGFLDVTEPDGLPDGISADQLLGNNGTAPVAAPPVTPPGGNTTGIDTSQGQQIIPTITPAPQSGARLTNPTLASGVGSDDCAIDNVNSFQDTAPAIYVVATAVDFPANTTITARWSFGGNVMGSYDIPFDFAIENACVWAFIDQTDFDFSPGTWTVELLINGQPAVGSLTFTILGAGNTTEDAMQDGS